MQNLIDEIVSDLISLDSEFASMEEDLRKLVSKLLKAKPHVKIDEQFKKQLKKEILQEASKIKKASGKNSPKFNFFNFFHMQKMAYALGGVILATLVFFTYQKLPLIQTSQDDFEVKVQEVGNEAFGNLSREVAGGELVAGGKGGGGGGMAEGMSYREDAPYEVTQYKYVYDGNLNLPYGDVEVLKRVKDASFNANNLISLISRFDFDLVDLDRFADVKLQNINLMEDKEYGYGIGITFDEGSVSIFQNYHRWPNPYEDCRGEDCYEKLRLGEKDMLSDSEILTVAQNFADDYGIDLKNYGDPEIQNSWKDEILRADAMGYERYYPESISVTYPLLIQGKEVYNQGGDYDGLNINVNQRYAKVDGAWGLQTQNYQASRYEGVDDEKLFRKFLEEGGLYGWTPPNPTKIIEIKLGDPEEVLMKYWNYANGENEELVLPALRFPILEKHDDIYQTAVVIPLVKQVLEEREQDDQPVFLERDMGMLDGTSETIETPPPAVDDTASDETSAEDN